MAAPPEFIIEKLDKRHDLSSFDCGNDALNAWLKRFALMNVANDTARVYVAHRSDRVVAGYHALVAGSVSREEAPERIGRGLPLIRLALSCLRASRSRSLPRARGLGFRCCKMRCCVPNKPPTPSESEPCSCMRLMPKHEGFI